MQNPVKTGRYQHYKGPFYQVYGTARHSETEETLVVYRCLYGEFDLWVRPLSLFADLVTMDGQEVPRFRWIDEGEPDQQLSSGDLL